MTIAMHEKIPYLYNVFLKNVFHSDFIFFCSCLPAVLMFLALDDFNSKTLICTSTIKTKIY
jgi:hypothetical protein